MIQVGCKQRLEKDIACNINKMKAGVALLISDKTDFRAKKKKQNM